MELWRKKTVPPCPKCGNWTDHVGHLDCPYNGEMQIDILSGMVKCDGCGAICGLEKIEHYCSCGAVYEGGEIWEGMHREMGRVQNLAWFQRLYARRGTMQVRFLRYDLKRISWQQKGDMGNEISSS